MGRRVWTLGMGLSHWATQGMNDPACCEAAARGRPDYVASGVEAVGGRSSRSGARGRRTCSPDSVGETLLAGRPGRGTRRSSQIISSTRQCGKRDFLQ